MFKEVLPDYKRFTEYSVYLLLLLIVLDIISTYIGIKYFNAYEANERTARLFEAFGILLPSALKVLAVIMLGHIIQLAWKNSEFLLYNTRGWMNSVAIISSLNLMLIILVLNVVYFIIVVHNINILYTYF
jgi:hypothetical protein